jgi:hypothetical protein
MAVRGDSYVIDSTACWSFGEPQLCDPENSSAIGNKF